MIEFTIKTLDSNNHNFQVEDEITIQQLKEKVREQMGIEINLQRLIFCGRVLQDEKKLSEYDVNGKVVHLVQRAPPSPESRHGGQSANPSGSADAAANGHQARRSAHVLREEQINLPNVTGRLDFIRLMISEIKTSLESLQGGNEENDAAPATAAASSEANVENMETDSAPSGAQEENDSMMEESGEAGPDSAARARRGHSFVTNFRPLRSMRARQSRLTQLAQLLEELDALQAQFAPHRAHLVRLLTETAGAELPTYTGPERESAQRVVDVSLEIMHSLAHAYHAVSDLNYQVGQRSPRLTSEAVVRMPQMQAHINVVQSNRRPAAPAAPAAPGAAPAAPATVTNPPATSAPTNTQCPPAPSEEAPVQAGRNTTQPTVNINIQPDPITYQVEIETRVPIAFALENALMNGLGGAQEPPAEQPPGAAGQPQANRRQVLFDFENLFRGLGQTGNLGGVEVVMSMEEIPNGGIVGQVPQGTGGPVGGQAPPTLQHLGMHHDGGVLLGPLPWGGAPSADLLQNIVSSVIRQGLLPQGEAVALQVAHGAAPADAGPPAAPGPQTGNLHLRRASTAARAATLNSFIYDRFLLCMSRHARRRMLRRREQQQNQQEGSTRPRADGPVTPSIDVLRQRNSNFNAAHIQTINDLLHRTPSRATFYNAFFVALARHLLLREGSEDSGATPADFEPTLRQLRHGLQVLLLQRGGVLERAAGRLADYFADQLEDYLSQPELEVSFVADYNVVASMRALLRARLPAVIGCVMSDSAADGFAARLYAALAQLYGDACALLAHCCSAGVDGMRAAVEAFVDQKGRLLRARDSAEIREALNTLNAATLRAVVAGLGAARPGAPVLQFVVRNDEPMNEELEPSTPPPERTASPPAPSPAPSAPAPSAPAPSAPAPPAPAPPAPPVPVPPARAPAPAAGASRAPEPEQPPRSIAIQATSPSRPEVAAASTRAMLDAQLTSFVPSMVVLQEWVPVLARDRDAQAGPPEPFSDAYLSGMPSRKRRCVRQARPPHTIDAFVAESVREASDRPAADTGAVRLAFREHMRAMARARASASDEFDPLRHASAARFLNPGMKKEPKNEDNA